ncbi:MAG TPA: hypothetical protein VF600_02490 [Abditibacteriaceae bacterium]|jgi:hypothetical protein
MLKTPFLRRQMLEIVQERLLPWARGHAAPSAAANKPGEDTRKHLLLLQPPLHPEHNYQRGFFGIPGSSGSARSTSEFCIVSHFHAQKKR